MIGKEILYKDYDGKIIKGIITYIGFENKTKSIIWYHVNFGYKAFLIEKNEILSSNQLSLF